MIVTRNWSPRVDKKRGIIGQRAQSFSWRRKIALVIYYTEE